jgi:hypothetical protein
MGCLEQLLAGVQVLSAYQLAFIQRIELLPQTQPPPYFGHELLQMGGCYTTFGRQLWEAIGMTAEEIEAFLDLLSPLS